MNKEQINLVTKLKESNTTKKNLLKAVEEFQELSLILTQRINKGKFIKDFKIIEEIGDCEIRLEVLKQLFNRKKISKRIDNKLKRIVVNKIGNGE